MCVVQCCLDSAPANRSSIHGSPEEHAIRSPVRERTTSHTSIPVRKVLVPMDPVLQAQRLKAAQELEALRRDDGLNLSQTGAVLLHLRLAACVPWPQKAQVAVCLSISMHSALQSGPCLL